MIKLKPCPKCKNKKWKHNGMNISLCTLKFPKVYKRRYVKCFDCDYKTQRAFTIRGAMKNWNARKEKN